MNPTNKKAPGAGGVPQPFNRQAGHAHHINPVVAQLKTVVSAQSVKRPVAPPVYRPQAMPKAVQPKMANGAMNRKPPVAPAVYRPQPAPKVLQTKRSSSQSPQVGQAPRQPVAPPVYRPELKKIVQPKAISQQRMPATAPSASGPQSKLAGMQAKTVGFSRLKNQTAPLPSPRQTAKVLASHAHTLSQLKKPRSSDAAQSLYGSRPVVIQRKLAERGAEGPPVYRAQDRAVQEKPLGRSAQQPPLYRLNGATVQPMMQVGIALGTVAVAAAAALWKWKWKKHTDTFREIVIPEDDSPEEIKKDVNAAMEKIKKRLENAGTDFNSLGRDALVYAPVLYLKSYLSTTTTYNVLESWTKSWDISKTAGLLCDIGSALKGIEQWSEKREREDEMVGTRLKRHGTLSDEHRKIRLENNVPGENWKFGPTGFAFQAGPSATTANLLKFLRTCGDITNEEIEAIMQAVTMFWEGPVKRITGEYHTAAEVWMAYEQHLETSRPGWKRRTEGSLVSLNQIDQARARDERVQDAMELYDTDRKRAKALVDAVKRREGPPMSASAMDMYG